MDMTLTIISGMMIVRLSWAVTEQALARGLNPLASSDYSNDVNSFEAARTECLTQEAPF